MLNAESTAAKVQVDDAHLQEMKYWKQAYMGKALMAWRSVVAQKKSRHEEIHRLREELRIAQDDANGLRAVIAGLQKEVADTGCELNRTAKLLSESPRSKVPSCVAAPPLQPPLVDVHIVRANAVLLCFSSEQSTRKVKRVIPGWLRQDGFRYRTGVKGPMGSWVFNCAGGGVSGKRAQLTGPLISYCELRRRKSFEALKMVKNSFSPTVWHMMTSLNPLDAQIPKIPFSIFFSPNFRCGSAAVRPAIGPLVDGSVGDAFRLVASVSVTVPRHRKLRWSSWGPV